VRLVHRRRARAARVLQRALPRRGRERARAGGSVLELPAQRAARSIRERLVVDDLRSRLRALAKEAGRELDRRSLGAHRDPAARPTADAGPGPGVRGHRGRRVRTWGDDHGDLRDLRARVGGCGARRRRARARVRGLGGLPRGPARRGGLDALGDLDAARRLRRTPAARGRGVRRGARQPPLVDRLADRGARARARAAHQARGADGGAGGASRWVRRERADRSCPGRRGDRRRGRRARRRRRRRVQRERRGAAPPHLELARTARCGPADPRGRARDRGARAHPGDARGCRSCAPSAPALRRRERRRRRAAHAPGRQAAGARGARRGPRCGPGGRARGTRRRARRTPRGRRRRARRRASAGAAARVLGALRRRGARRCGARDHLRERPRARPRGGASRRRCSLPTAR
jgi:hypothetical protein